MGRRLPIRGRIFPGPRRARRRRRGHLWRGSTGSCRPRSGRGARAGRAARPQQPLPTLDEAIEELSPRRRPLRPDPRQPLQGRDRAPRHAQGRPQRPLPVRQRQKFKHCHGAGRPGLTPRRPPGGSMRLQLLSDLHLETERYDPEPARGAELLVLAGDIDSELAGLERFRGWPQPMVFVAGNHEFDGRDLTCLAGPARALRGPRHHPARARDPRRRGAPAVASASSAPPAGATSTCSARPAGRKAMRAAGYFAADAGTRGGRPLDAEAIARKRWRAGAGSKPS